MSTLFNQINDDLKNAMREKNTVKVSSLRMLKSAILNAQINNKAAVDDSGILSLVAKQISQRKDSIEQYRKGNREDLASAEQAEINILAVYLPQQISDDDLKKQIESVLTTHGLNSKKDFGKAIKLIQTAVKGQADNKRISSLLNQHLK